MLHREIRELYRGLRAASRSGVGGVCFAAILLVNGKIWTGDAVRPEAQAIAIVDDRIAEIGSNEEVLKLQSGNIPVFDLQNRRVVPGFDDAHVHFLEGGFSLTGPQLRAAKSRDEFRNTLAAFAKQQPRGHWITNGEWDNENWSDKALPDAKLIDAVTSHWPVFVSRMDGHMSLANSVALEKAHITRKTPDVPGGIIVRDDKGNPTGILKDAAQNLVRQVIPPPSDDEMRVAIRAAQAYANALGVTSVQDMSVTPELLRVYSAMEREGSLRVRIAGFQPLKHWQRLADVGVSAPFGDKWLHIGGVKGFADGSLGSGTALFFRPYSDNPKNSGIPSDELSDPKQMWENIRGADEAKLQIAVHAIGDKANAEILGFYARLEQRDSFSVDRRLRIEHAQHLTKSEIPQFGQMHVIASMQPYQCIDDGRWAEQKVGPERAKTSYAFRSLLDSNAMLAFGSDWPVITMSPIQGIYAAVTRRTLDGKHPDGWIPQQKITVGEAVRAYTYGSAYASFDEGEKGTLSRGKLADLVVLSDDIFSIDPVKMQDVRVEAVMLGGRLVIGELPRRKDPSGLLIR